MTRSRPASPSAVAEPDRCEVTIGSGGRCRLLSVDSIRTDYGIGRDLARGLGRRLPHVEVGRGRMMVVRSAFDELVTAAAAQHRDLWEIARWSDAVFTAWCATHMGSTHALRMAATSDEASSTDPEAGQ